MQTRRYAMALAVPILCAVFALPAAAQVVFLEAEMFSDVGGWDIDQQSIEQMGSSYLLAHGLGVPVADAMTRVQFPEAGQYRVWVRTRDWVAPWKAPGAPGKFQVLVNDVPLATTFGTEGESWHWQDGGLIEVGSEAKIALHDLTGFEGRCDAIVFCRDIGFQPPNDRKILPQFRRQHLGLSDQPDDGGQFDLVVVGGGIAGLGTALSAARQGLAVALIQDRPVLGGNGSSEVRVWPEGKTNQKPYRHVGDMVEELLTRKGAGDGNAKGKSVYGDERKKSVVQAEPRIKLYTEQRVFKVEMNAKAIAAVISQHTRTARYLKVTGKLFADCTGDATVGYLAGADYEVTRERHMGMSNLWNVLDAADSKQVLMCECKDKTALAVATEAGNVAMPFPRCPWAIDLSDKPFPGRKNEKGQWGSDKALDNLGGWFWESGFDRDPIEDVEYIRDLNFRAMYGAWDALKNVDKAYPNHRIGWAAFIAGKRESRRLLGDVVLTVDDFLQERVYPDGAYPCTWHIDLHLPDKSYQKGLEGNEFISKATEGEGYRYKGPYWAPYRTLYSRNIDNLFMAGRDISVSHEALGPVRVMRTCGMMGEIVGKAAWICVKNKSQPRDVYTAHLSTLKDLMEQPGVMRRDSIESELKLPPGATVPARYYTGLDPASVGGLVVDDEAATLTGTWTEGAGLAGFVGDGYHYSGDKNAKAVFRLAAPAAGKYDVRVAWQPHANRAKSATIVVAHGNQQKKVIVNQSQATTGEKGFQSIESLSVMKDDVVTVTFLVEGSQGLVHIDAVQLMPE